ncbi:hypothetical protein PM10SUCC1_10770 [Propionigenium maris DSM 9537]|uniref:Sporulation lipoprotein YhcN/YlaJ (Spore_YhcN_YlaJ) n=1 Tax=Propionigenium maris DSM 9537 TaxID=1123000 RepID=A0A9W6LML1_9FUSO|nr:hypothetical protein [Propionigenium maris]GLI55563.1 hypothetical protein PM10SUCC1_10770 [Propionigenium maris DSM 9537]
MKKRMIMGFCTALLLMTGCTSLEGLGSSSSSKSPMSQERIAASVDVNDEIFGIGSAPIVESGQGVAKMRANKEAREDIRKKLQKETEDVLTAYLVEIDFYSKKISDNVMEDLSEYISNNMLNDTEEKDSWVENDRIYTVIAIDRDEVPLRSRDTFVTHIDSIIKKLTDLKGQILNIPIEAVQKEPVVTTSEKVEVTEEAAPVVEETPVKEEAAPAETPESVELSDTDEDIIDVQL